LTFGTQGTLKLHHSTHHKFHLKYQQNDRAFYKMGELYRTLASPLTEEHRANERFCMLENYIQLYGQCFPAHFSECLT